MKPVRFLFYIFVSFFVPDHAQRLIAFPSFWTFWPTETLHWFIQSQFVNKKTKNQPPPPQALRLSHGLAKRRARNASDWWRRTRDQGKGKEGRFSAVSPVFSFPPSFARQFSSSERRLGTGQTKDCKRSGSFRHELQPRYFQLWRLTDFITSLLYTNYGMKCDPIQMIDTEQYFAPIIFLYKGSWLKNLWVKSKVWPFKWKLLSSTFLCLLSFTKTA